MPVELRCPDCRAMLRLGEYPDPGTEVECPKCQTVFPAPDPDTGEVPDARGKKKPREGADDKPKAKAAKKPPLPKAGPKKKKAKRKETNKVLLYALIGGGVLFVALVGGLLFWFFNRTSAAVEMMTYLPEDCWTASGGNLGHLQKYPEFFTKVEAVYGSQPFVGVAGALGSALGQKPNDYLDYVVTGTSKGGGYAVVIRTKKEFDPGVLAKLPSARESTVGGQKVYATTVDGASIRAFAPTKRLVVFAAAGVGDGTLGNMVKGNRENSDKTLPGRAGPLAKRTAKGTAWVYALLEASDKPAVKEGDSSGQNNENAFKSHTATLLSSAKGIGAKASVGSRSVRFEVIFLMNNAEAADDLYKKFQDSGLAKSDLDEPPKWWKEMANQLGSKKVEAELRSNVTAKTSGELFVYYSEVDTRLVMDVVQNVGSRVIGMGGGGGGGGGGGEGQRGGPRGGPRPGEQ